MSDEVNDFEKIWRRLFNEQSFRESLEFLTTSVLPVSTMTPNLAFLPENWHAQAKRYPIGSPNLITCFYFQDEV